MAARIPDPISLAFQYGPYILLGYYGYIKYTNQPSILGPNDPILKIINDIQAALYQTPPPLVCLQGYHLSNGVCVADTSPPPTTCNTGYHLSNGVCVPDTTTPPPTADTNGPLILVANPPSNATGATFTMGPGQIIIAGSTIDRPGESGVKQVRLRVNTDAWVVATPTIAGDFTRWNLPITFNMDGYYAIQVESTDNAGNATYLTVPLIVQAGAPAAPPPPSTIPLPTIPTGTPPPPPSGGDTVAPTVRIDSPIPNASVPAGGFQVRGVASDNVAVAAVHLRIDNDPWVQCVGTTTWALNVIINTTGTHLLQARATDTAGNMQWFDTSIVVVAAGTPPPPPPTTCPTGYTLTNGVCVANPPPPVTCNAGYHLSGGVCVPDTITPPPTGGDTTAPTLAITSPANNATIPGTSQSITVTGTASDASGIVEVVTRITNVGQGTPWVPATATATGYATWQGIVDISQYPPQTAYNIEARALDGAGNYQWRNITVNLAPIVPPVADSTPPTVTFTQPVDGGTVIAGVTQGYPNQIRGTAFDAGSGVAQVRIWVGTTTPYICTLTQASNGTVNWTGIWNFISPSTHTLHAVAVDAAGNVSSEVTIQVNGVAASGYARAMRGRYGISRRARAMAYVTSKYGNRNQTRVRQEEMVIAGLR